MAGTLGQGFLYHESGLKFDLPRRYPSEACPRVVGPEVGTGEEGVLLNLRRPQFVRWRTFSKV